MLTDLLPRYSTVNTVNLDIVDPRTLCPRRGEIYRKYPAAADFRFRNSRWIEIKEKLTSFPGLKMIGKYFEIENARNFVQGKSRLKALLRGDAPRIS